jgi:ABC-2 type transport system permease protein
MPGLPDPGHSYAIAKNEARIGWRKFRGKSTIQALAAGVAVLFGLVFTAGAGFLGYIVGQDVVDDPSSVLEVASVAPASIAVFTLFLTAYLTVIQFGDIDARDGYLTTLPARDVVGGLLVAGYLRIGGMFSAPLLVACAGFAAGAGEPLVFPLAAVGLFVLTLVSYLVGFPLGAGVAYLLGQSTTVERFKPLLGLAAFVAYFGLILTNTLDEAVEPLVSVFQLSPVAWFADLALLPAIPEASALQAVAVLAGSPVVGVLGVLASVRISERRWYDDGVDAEAKEAESASGGRLDAVLGRRTAWVARKSWLRARRAPIKLLFVAYPLFVLVSPVQRSVEAGYVTATLPATVALYGAWLTGALFTLNPLGDEGAVLPVTTITGVSGREFVGGLVAASSLVGLPLTLVVTTVLAVLSPLPPLAVVCTVVAAAVLPPLAATVAAGVGTEFPKYETTNVTRSREAVIPSMWAFAGYTLVFLVTAGFATGVQAPFVAEPLADALGVSTAVVRVGSLTTGVVLAGLAAGLGARRAVQTFDEYTTDGQR